MPIRSLLVSHTSCFLLVQTFASDIFSESLSSTNLYTRSKAWSVVSPSRLDYQQHQDQVLVIESFQGLAYILIVTDTFVSSFSISYPSSYIDSDQIGINLPSSVLRICKYTITHSASQLLPLLV
jgi:hypothetical protein